MPSSTAERGEESPFQFSLMEEGDKDTNSNAKNEYGDSSTFAMLSFALPALGIFLSPPLLSNIDNAFVGKTIGVEGLAALSPATICIDQILYLFSFLSRATTGIVSRAYSSGSCEQEKIFAVREAASTPFTIAIFCGICLSIFYAFLTPQLLAILQVDPDLIPAASSYIYWRGAIATAALVQSVCLAVLLSTRDAITPLKIVALSAVVDIIGNFPLCVYPFRWGCAGAAAATAFATLFSSGHMLMNLSKKKLLPSIAIPKLADLKELFEYVGPLFVLVISRMIGFVSMQRRAMVFGTDALAAYQICFNTMSVFQLFGEPLSQLHQTKLPALLDARDKKATLSTMVSVLSIACYTSIGIGLTTYLTLVFGAGLFTADADVQSIINNAAPAIAFSVMQVIMAATVDGAMLAARDFNFIIVVGLLTTTMHVILSTQCTNLSAVFVMYTLRQVAYMLAVLVRVVIGKGTIGEVLEIKQEISWKS